MPKIVDYEERRREIMQKAVPVFAREGYQRANFSRIAELCGFSRTTIYQYFKNKSELFLYTIDRVFMTIEVSAHRANVETGGTTVDRLERIMRAIFETTLAEAQPLSIVLDLWLQLKREDARFGAEVRKRVEHLIDGIAEVLRDGEARGELKPMDVRSMAITLFSILESFSIHAPFVDSIDIEAHVAALRILFSGLERAQVAVDARIPSQDSLIPSLR
jgi:AcrR family transcriptional regulator